MINTTQEKNGLKNWKYLQRRRHRVYDCSSDLDAVKELNPYLNAFKVGSGDITFKEELEFTLHIISQYFLLLELLL